MYLVSKIQFPRFWPLSAMGSHLAPIVGTQLPALPVARLAMLKDPALWRGWGFPRETLFLLTVLPCGPLAKCPPQA